MWIRVGLTNGWFIMVNSSNSVVLEKVGRDININYG